jgi:hypothetical protein
MTQKKMDETNLLLDLINKQFQGRFIIYEVTYDAYTFAPIRNFFDRFYEKNIQIKDSGYNGTTECLIDYVKNDLPSVRDKKIDDIIN